MNLTTGFVNNSASTSFPSDDEEDFVTGHMFPFLYLAIILLGFPANCFSVFVSYQHIRHNNELGIYLMNLALADIFFILMLPVWVDYILADVWRHGGTACVACVFLIFTHFYASVSLLCCIAVNRYLAIVHPLRFSFIRKPRIATCISVLSWACSMAFNGITVFKVDVYKEDKCLHFYPLPADQVPVNIARFIVWFLLPSVLVGFCYKRISQEVRSNQATEEQESRKVCRLLMLVLITLAICFGPIHIMLLLRASLENAQTYRLLFYPYKMSVALATLNCLADPLLYCFITRSGRASVTRAVRLLKRRVTNNNIEGESKQ